MNNLGIQIKLDSDGNIVFAGDFSSDKVWLDNNTTIDGISTRALIMAKYNEQGNLIWNKKLFESTVITDFDLIWILAIIFILPAHSVSMLILMMIYYCRTNLRQIYFKI